MRQVTEMSSLRLTPHRRVSFVPLRTDARAHERATHIAIAQQLATLLDVDFVCHSEAAGHEESQTLGYVVPDTTITSLALARRLGIQGEDDLFGGVVPEPYMASKTITHPLVRVSAAAPPGWCADFARKVEEAVLPGFSVFTLEDARTAARELLRQGPVRLKLACGIGGSGQVVVDDECKLEPVLAALPQDEVRMGLVVECNLVQVRTFSLGYVRLGALEASYVGEQHTTRNRVGMEVYGGSTLTVVRGGFEGLAASTPDPDMRAAIAHARTYHDAAVTCLGGMFASRCNYDIAHGMDAQGRWRTGVLEQSWRIGGASGAEVAALQAFADDPSLNTVRASTVEKHEDVVELPKGAVVYYRGTDPHVGPITKYAILESP
jgi:hypothetical protein